MSLVYEYSFLSEAEEEYIDAIRWYSKINTTLAAKLIEDFNKVISRICVNPSAQPIYFKHYHKLNLENFPFKIVYKVFDNIVLIVAIAHHKQKPKYWRKRKL